MSTAGTMRRFLSFPIDQPEPMWADVVHTSNAAGWMTAICRLWESTDDTRRCRLCPVGRCTAKCIEPEDESRGATCLVAVNKYVSQDDAYLFSACGKTWGHPQVPESSA